VKKLIKYIFIILLPISFIISLKPAAKKPIKIVREIQINFVPNFNNNGLNKADSG